jgi:hypothetical protein
MTLNMELLTKVRDFIVAEPERFDINFWFDTASGDHDIPRDAERFVRGDCGTTACIAGAAMVIAGRSSEMTFDNTPQCAADVLGLDAHALFYASQWPVAYQYMMEDSEGCNVAPKLIDDMLAGTVTLTSEDEDEWIETDVIFWSQFARNSKP